MAHGLSRTSDNLPALTWLASAFAGALLVGALMLGAVSYMGDLNAPHHDVDASIQTQPPNHG